MNNAARERILRAGAAIMHVKGFQGTGLAEVLAAAHAPKGSFYHYFPSKEAFGLAVLAHFEEGLGAMGQEVLALPGLSAQARLDALVERFREFFAGRGYTLGCPIGKLAQEMGDLSEAFQQHLAARPTPLTRIMAAIIAQGQAEGDFDPGLEAEEAARFLAGAWQGALIRMKVERGPGPLTLFTRYAKRLLATSGETPTP
ncbi:MAG: TetR/AcrR family transcriptional regulator [Solidesulfovibrio sp. DCME]|uniref:TetR/AcrR family transcriptional regulator n=1 Tax=Solidesulfovibrio sp. DCME TaxID=3447380 RepID=UPI003D10BB77